MSAEPAPRPWQRLSWRITMFFLLAAVPGVLLAGGTVFVLDRLIKDEISHRGTETHAATERALEMQRRRVEEQLAALSKHEALRQLAVAIDDEGAVERAEPLAGALAASLGLDLMAIGARRGPGANTLISSAHLRDAIGDAIPRDIPAGGTPRAGFVRELVAGNPPERVPALVAAVSLDDDTGRPALVVYGGVRLDADLLDAIARGAGATLILEAPGAPAERFPRGARAAESATSVGLIELPALAREGGRARHARIEVVVDIGRLVHARRRVLGLAGGLTVAALCGAVLAGTWLSRRISRPIVELSRAAGAIGAGALDVQVPGGGRDELGTLVTAFNDMVGELKESRERVARAERVAAWREAARRIAHEIKNPLFPMQMAMDTLRKAFRTQHPELPAIAEESTKVVLEEIRSISRLVSEFSEFARLPRPRLEPTDPVALLGHAATLHAHRPEGAQLVLERARLEALGLPKVMADGEQITRALTNLVKNAVEAIGPTAGTVTLDAEESRRGARRGVALTVRDTGPGMTEEVRARLFEPYFTTKTDGSGLGLSIVERIIAEHDGALDVESELGRGTVFRVWLAADEAA